MQAHLDSRYQLLAQYKQRRQTHEAALNDLQRQLDTPSEEVRKIHALTEQQQALEQQVSQIDTWLNQQTQRYQQEYQQIASQRSQLEAQSAEVDKRLRDIEKGIVENARAVGTTLTKTTSK